MLPRIVARSSMMRVSALLPASVRQSQPLIAQRVRYVSGYGTNESGGNESGMPPLKGFDKKQEQRRATNIASAEATQASPNVSKQSKYETQTNQPLSEQMADMKGDLKEAGSEMLEGMKSTFNTFKDKVNQKLDENMAEGKRAVNRGAAKIENATADKPRRFHTSAAPRLQQGDISSTIKKAGRKIKETVDNVMGADPAAPGSETMRKSDQWSDSTPVREAAKSQTLSTGARQRGVRGTDAAAGSVEPVTEPVKSALWDGPQEMPQGVGKRARDDLGRPMETGARRT